MQAPETVSLVEGGSLVVKRVDDDKNDGQLLRCRDDPPHGVRKETFAQTRSLNSLIDRKSGKENCGHDRILRLSAEDIIWRRISRDTKGGEAVVADDASVSDEHKRARGL
jgi:hypothetical protein